LALAALCSQATPIGQFSFGGNAEVTLSTIDWLPSLPGAPYDGTGDIVALGPGTGIFSAVSIGDLGTIVDRDALGGTVPPQPAGAPILVMNWLVLPSLGSLVLDLTFILPGIYTSTQCGLPAANEDTCTPAAPPPFTSPYNLSNFFDGDGLSSNAAFSVRGNVRDTSSGLVVGYFEGIFGAEFKDQSLEDVLAAVTAPGGSVMVDSYSATITATEIPEPSSVSLFALGSVMVMGGLLCRRLPTRIRN
jgi:hypothetical protein